MLAASDGGFFYLSYSPQLRPGKIRHGCRAFVYYMVPGAGVEPAEHLDKLQPGDPDI